MATSTSAHNPLDVQHGPVTGPDLYDTEVIPKAEVIHQGLRAIITALREDTPLRCRFIGAINSTSSLTDQPTLDTIMRLTSHLQARGALNAHLDGEHVDEVISALTEALHADPRECGSCDDRHGILCPTHRQVSA